MSRYNYIKKSTSTLCSRFWNESFKDFWSKNNKFKDKKMWQTFIAANQVNADKTSLCERVAIVRNTIAYIDIDKNTILSN